MRILLLLAFLVCGHAGAAAHPPVVEGMDLLTKKEITVNGKELGLVVLFLSSRCPCSNSHNGELTALAKEFPQFAFVAIHSNQDEMGETAYFEKAHFPFPVIEDKGAKIAEQFKALKTPHAFVIKPGGEIAYQGGVSSSTDFARAKEKFLRDALGDLTKKQDVRTPRGRTLGCVINRGA